MTAFSGLTYHLSECENEISQFGCIVCTLRIKQQLPTDNRNYSHWWLNTGFSFPPSSRDWQIRGWQEKVSRPTIPALWKVNKQRYRANHRNQSVNIQIHKIKIMPGSGRSPGEGNGNPLQYSCLENPMDRGAWRATCPWGRKESDLTERLTH